LSAIKLLAPVLTEDNLMLLEQARFKSKREVERLLVRHFAKPDVPQMIRRLPVTARPHMTTTTRESVLELPMFMPQGHSDRSAGSNDSHNATSTGISDSHDATSTNASDSHDATSTNASANDCHDSIRTNANDCHDSIRTSTATSTNSGSPLPAPATRPRTAICRGEPLSEGRYKLQFTAEQRLYDKLKQAQALLRHQVPNGDIAVVFERALDLLIAQRRKQHFAATERPRSPTAARGQDCARDNPTADHERPSPSAQSQRAHSRHIPHAVRRQVLARDGEQCSYVSSDGRRCQQRERLQFHHRLPYARGGAATPANIQLLCQAHNALWAERDFGPELILQRIAQRRAHAEPPRASSQLVPGQVLPESGAGLRKPVPP
jgi:5-methylcytosine-specific restriction endonuclease McrA